MKTHNEQKDDERFVGNSLHKSLESLTSKGVVCRYGDTAYYIDGEVIPPLFGYKPLFIHKDSFMLYNTIMEANLRLIQGHRRTL